MLRYVLSSVFLFSAYTSARSQEAQCATVADCAQKAMEAAYQAKLAASISVPKGAVMAFNLDKCPDGWGDLDTLAGRVIVAAGQGVGLTERKFKDQGGEEAHTLTVDEMPNHNHSNGGYQYLLTSDGKWTIQGADESNGEPNLRALGGIAAAGGNKPHSVMQPFYVLKYCERR